MTLPPTIVRTPALDRWLRFSADGSVFVHTGKVEIGQGIKTAIAMIAAEELDVDLSRIRIQTADTEVTPNEFVTAGSMSVEDSGGAVRIASATARQLLFDQAAEQLGVPRDTLRALLQVIPRTYPPRRLAVKRLIKFARLWMLLSQSPALT